MIRPRIYWALAAGILLVVAAFCPLLEKNGIAVNAFQTELGLKAGFFLLPAGLAFAGLSLVSTWWADLLRGLLTTGTLLITFNYWWQGRHLDAVGWGSYLLLAAACLMVVAMLLRMVHAQNQQA